MSLHHREEQLTQLRKWFRTVLQLLGHCVPHFPIYLISLSLPKHTTLTSVLPSALRYKDTEPLWGHQSQSTLKRVQAGWQGLSCDYGMSSIVMHNHSKSVTFQFCSLNVCGSKL